MAELLAWIVPTRGGPAAVERLHKAWSVTCTWDAHLVLLVDDDDPQRAEYVRLAGRGHAMIWPVGPWQPMVRKLNRAAVELADEGYAALGFGGDDHVPRTPYWARRYLDALAELGTGIVYGDDLVQGRRLPTQWAMTADIVRTLGRMVPANVEHLYCDNAILALGQTAGCIRHLPDVVVEHVHPIAGKAAMDDQYRRVNAPEQYRRDQAAYQTWVRDQLDQDAAAVRVLRIAGQLQEVDDGYETA